MCRKSFFLLVKIVLVDLIAREVQASVPGGDPAGSAPKVGVQDSVTRFGVVLEYPGVEGNGLLCGVDSPILVSSTPAEEWEIKTLCSLLKACPRKFTI